MELSRDSKKIIKLAGKQSKKTGGGVLATEYLLFGFLKARDRTSREIAQSRMSHHDLAGYIDRIYKATPSDKINGTTPRYDEAIEFAKRRAMESGGGQVEPVHLFLGLMACGGEDRQGMVHQVMRDFEIIPDEWAKEALDNMPA